MPVTIVADNAVAYLYAQEDEVAETLWEEAQTNKYKSGVVSAVLAENSVAKVYQYYYGHEEEIGNGWIAYVITGETEQTAIKIVEAIISVSHGDNPELVTRAENPYLQNPGLLN